jgi:hypothetical protein
MGGFSFSGEEDLVNEIGHLLRRDIPASQGDHGRQGMGRLFFEGRASVNIIPE